MSDQRSQNSACGPRLRIQQKFFISGKSFLEGLEVGQTLGRILAIGLVGIESDFSLQAHTLALAKKRARLLKCD